MHPAGKVSAQRFSKSVRTVVSNNNANSPVANTTTSNTARRERPNDGIQPRPTALAQGLHQPQCRTCQQPEQAPYQPANPAATCPPVSHPATATTAARTAPATSSPAPPTQRLLRTLQCTLQNLHRRGIHQTQQLRQRKPQQQDNRRQQTAQHRHQTGCWQILAHQTAPNHSASANCNTNPSATPDQRRQQCRQQQGKRMVEQHLPPRHPHRFQHRHRWQFAPHQAGGSQHHRCPRQHHTQQCRQPQKTPGTLQGLLHRGQILLQRADAFGGFELRFQLLGCNCLTPCRITCKQLVETWHGWRVTTIRWPSDRPDSSTPRGQAGTGWCCGRVLASIPAPG